MSDTPRDLTLERVNRLTTAIADLADSHAAQGRQFSAMMQRLADQMDRIEDKLVAVEDKLVSLGRDVRMLASEQALLGNRVESAFSRALRVNIRLDAMEDKAP